MIREYEEKTKTKQKISLQNDKNTAKKGQASLFEISVLSYFKFIERVSQRPVSWSFMSSLSLYFRGIQASLT